LSCEDPWAELAVGAISIGRIRGTPSEATTCGDDAAVVEVEADDFRFIHWDSPPRRQATSGIGRLVSTRDGFISYAQPTTRKAVSADVIVPNIRVKMVRGKGPFRTQVPPMFMMLKGALDASVDECRVCKTSGEECSICRVGFHLECDSKLLQDAGVRGVPTQFLGPAESDLAVFMPAPSPRRPLCLSKLYSEAGKEYAAGRKLQEDLAEGIDGPLLESRCISPYSKNAAWRIHH
jgi:hypothetical protein